MKTLKRTREPEVITAKVSHAERSCVRQLTPAADVRHYGQRIKAREKKRNKNKNCRRPREWNRERNKTKTISQHERISVKV